MTNSIIPQKLADVREFMSQNNLQAFIVPSTDAHLSEYPALHWESRVWISGFTGSAGTIVITDKECGLWTDSRYFLQAEQELQGSTINLFKEGLNQTPSITNWLGSTLSKNANVGIDARVYAAKDAQILEEDLHKKGLNLVIDKDPFDAVWKDRPEIPTNKIFILPETYTGESAKSKIERVCKAVKEEDANSLLVASLDTIAWLYNVRGNDVKCNPVAVCYAYISEEESVLFINPSKLTDEASTYLQTQGVKLAEYNKVFDYIASRKETICLDANKVTLKLLNIASVNNNIIDIPSPADLMKGCKNETELNGFRNAMKKDGVALVKFLMWLENTVGHSNVSEIDIPGKLIEYRSQQELFVGESFDTISGYGPNGAIVHYHVSPKSSLEIKPKGFLLVDSGAQYFDGTTDITRTIAVGELTEQMKKDYTMVLKGHISIATAIYPEGTRGSQLDILARKTLWDEGLNYLHGTGHGIGHFLNVHEGPQSIRMNENSTTLHIGMVTSNEPGLYRAGEYGIRIENLVATKQEKTTEFGDFYSFETLTLCPIDKTPIVKDMLTTKELEWFNNYHQQVYKELSQFLNENENKWLKEKTNAL